MGANPGTGRHWTQALTHAGRAVVVGLEALIASPLATTLVAAVGVSADGAVGGAHRGELGAFIFVWGSAEDGQRNGGVMGLRFRGRTQDLGLREKQYT